MNDLPDHKTNISKYPLVFSCFYLFIYYTRPQDNIPGLDALPWVGVFFLLFTIWGFWLLFTKEKNMFKKPVVLIFWLGVIFGISGIGAISPISFVMSFKWITQTFPQVVVLVVIFSSAARLKQLHNFWVFVYFIMAVFTLKNAPLGPGDFTRDPNDAALALGMGVPMVFYALGQRVLSIKRRLYYYAVLALIVLAIVATSSRGGFLGFIAGWMTIWWMSKNRTKIMMYTLAISILAGGALVSFLPDRYVEDMKSISDKKDSTRVERLRTWEIGIEMFKANPILGVGAGNFANNVHIYQPRTSWWTGHQRSLSGRASHSLYFQIIPDLGLIGVGVYFFIMCILPLRLLKISKKLDESDDLQKDIQLFCRALIASMAVYAVAGAFISVAYYPHIPIWLAMYTIIVTIIKDNYPAVLSNETNLKSSYPHKAHL